MSVAAALITESLKNSDYRTILVLALVCIFLNPVQATCTLEPFVKLTPSEYSFYNCVLSQDFEKDLEEISAKSSKSVSISFQDSKVPEIEKDSFQKFGTKVVGISIVHCTLKSIHDEAFNGLTELKSLILHRNRLTEVKKPWFADLRKLEILDLSVNMIHKFDPTIFDLIPLIQEFTISQNQLARFHIDTMKSKWPKLKRADLLWNPYGYSQGVEAVEYIYDHFNALCNSYAAIDGLHEIIKFVKECQNVMARKENSVELEKCVQLKLSKSVQKPADGPIRFG